MCYKDAEVPQGLARLVSCEFYVQAIGYEKVQEEPNSGNCPGITVAALPRPSYVVPFWVVCCNPLPKNHNRPKKELHRSPWVDVKAHDLRLLNLSQGQG